MPAAAEPLDGLRTSPGVVISMADRARRLRNADQPAVPAAPDDDVYQQIGERIEALFISRGRTLTDDATADAFLITMDGVIGMMAGTLAEGIIDTAQHDTIKSMLEGMRRAPRTL